MDRAVRQATLRQLKEQGWAIEDLSSAPGAPTSTYFDRYGRRYDDLPIDPYSLRHYARKGFRLVPPANPLPVPPPKEEVPVSIGMVPMEQDWLAKFSSKE